MANFKTKLENRIAKAQEAKVIAQDKALEALLDNDTFIETQRSVTAKEAELTALSDTLAQLSSIAPYVAKDGRKFSIKAFPVSAFGIGMGSVVGIIASSKSAFVDEKMMEYAAISGITSLELYESANALGSPAYYKDGKVVDGTVGDYTLLRNLIEGILIKLNLHEISINDFTREKYDLWFALAENRAEKQLKEHEALQDLEANAEDFVLED